LIRKELLLGGGSSWGHLAADLTMLDEPALKIYRLAPAQCPVLFNPVLIMAQATVMID